MLIRQAEVADIDAMSEVRLSVTENVLSNPELVTYHDYVDYLTRRGKGWVAEAAGRIVGFAIADLQDHSIWALFVHPDSAGQGIGRALHDTMLSWYFQQTNSSPWLGTAPGSRAEAFYRRAGWRSTGLKPNGEMGFEITQDAWLQAL